MSTGEAEEKEQDIDRWLGGRSFDDWRTQFDDRGYVIFENVLSPDEISGYRDALEPHLEENLQGRNDFEGLKTNRVYALLAKDPIFADMVTHPLALAFADAELGESCLLSSLLAINLQPGETVQPWHRDDGHIGVPMPHPPFGISRFWALDETTAENGATELLPGSHNWSLQEFEGTLKSGDFSNREMRGVDDDPGFRADAVTATMPAGSLMVVKSTLWHRGGANRSNAPRLIVTPQYCLGWARQLENMMAVIPRQIAAGYPKRVRELIGYSIHPPFMGYADGRHPDKLLDGVGPS